MPERHLGQINLPIKSETSATRAKPRLLRNIVAGTFTPVPGKNQNPCTASGSSEGGRPNESGAYAGFGGLGIRETPYDPAIHLAALEPPLSSARTAQPVTAYLIQVPPDGLSDQLVWIGQLGMIVKRRALGLALPQVGQRISRILVSNARIAPVACAAKTLDAYTNRRRRLNRHRNRGSVVRGSPHPCNIRA